MAGNRKTKPRSQVKKMRVSKSLPLKAKKGGRTKRPQQNKELIEELVREEVIPSAPDTGAKESSPSAKEKKAGSKELADGEIQLVCFSLGAEEFAVDIQKVQEIIRLTEINVVPDCSPDLKGVLSLRGRIIPVIDLRRRMGLAENDSGRHTRVIVLDHNNKLTGIIVDSVTQVIRVSCALIAPAPGRVINHEEKYISGICQNQDTLIMVIDYDRLLGQ